VPKSEQGRTIESVFSERAKEQQIRKPEFVKQISAEQKKTPTN
jgi:hypothetical protein